MRHWCLSTVHQRITKKEVNCIYRVPVMLFEKRPLLILFADELAFIARQQEQQDVINKPY